MALQKIYYYDNLNSAINQYIPIPHQIPNNIFRDVIFYTRSRLRLGKDNL